MSECIHAWTSAGDYKSHPRYLNVSRKDGAIVITVRSPEDLSGEYPLPGALASCALPDEEFGELVIGLVAFALFNGPVQDNVAAKLQATLASVDTHAKRGDSPQSEAPSPMGSAVGEAETPK